MAKMTNYLVFESSAPPDHSGAPTVNGQEVGPAPLFPYQAVCAVRAKDPVEAVQAVMGRTRRIGRYAVIEAEIIDFTSGLFRDAEADEVPQLLP